MKKSSVSFRAKSTRKPGGRPQAETPPILRAIPEQAETEGLSAPSVLNQSTPRVRTGRRWRRGKAKSRRPLEVRQSERDGRARPWRVRPGSGAVQVGARRIDGKPPQCLQSSAERMLREPMYAEPRADAGKAFASFAARHRRQYPKTVEFELAAEPWEHLRTTNDIESPFATVRLCQRVIKSTDSRSKSLWMAFEPVDMAQQRSRKLDGTELLPLARPGAKSVDGVRVERGDTKGGRSPDPIEPLHNY